MSESRHFISIWFFIGILLLAYGILICATSIYGLFFPPEREVVLAHLHAGIWWGALLGLLGGFYCRHFFPGKGR